MQKLANQRAEFSTVTVKFMFTAEFQYNFLQTTARFSAGSRRLTVSNERYTSEILPSF